MRYWKEHMFSCINAEGAAFDVELEERMAGQSVKRYVLLVVITMGSMYQPAL